MGFMPSRTTGEKSPDINWEGGWVCPREGLGPLEKREFFSVTGVETGFPICLFNVGH
jgi:hypothetical protein